MRLRSCRAKWGVDAPISSRTSSTLTSPVLLSKQTGRVLGLAHGSAGWRRFARRVWWGRRRRVLRLGREDYPQDRVEPGLGRARRSRFRPRSPNRDCKRRAPAPMAGSPAAGRSSSRPARPAARRGFRAAAMAHSRRSPTAAPPPARPAVATRSRTRARDPVPPPPSQTIPSVKRATAIALDAGVVPAIRVTVPISLQLPRHAFADDRARAHDIDRGSPEPCQLRAGRRRDPQPFDEQDRRARLRRQAGRRHRHRGRRFGGRHDQLARRVVRSTLANRSTATASAAAPLPATERVA